ncbi:hypothetical protein [Ferrimicrobium acidiphilum]|jgi:hypothetical protein|uniref:hypothetical protein n=1 Tax=Ferrimicrobium acidiphilum TaxID=121039 RepID=UPI0023F14F20|nr:hypothetical protein [Ferrimicrobium acidiphilum]
MLQHKPPGPGGGQFYSVAKPVYVIAMSEITRLVSSFGVQTTSAVATTLIINRFKRKKKRSKNEEFSVKIHHVDAAKQRLREKKTED